MIIKDTLAGIRAYEQAKIVEARGMRGVLLSFSGVAKLPNGEETFPEISDFFTLKTLSDYAEKLKKSGDVSPRFC